MRETQRIARASRSSRAKTRLVKDGAHSDVLNRVSESGSKRRKTPGSALSSAFSQVEPVRGCLRTMRPAVVGVAMARR